jgi:hypothetical protein
MEAQDEADSAAELGEVDEGLDLHQDPRQGFAAALGAAGFFLNIWSIRSVTT